MTVKLYEAKLQFREFDHNDLTFIVAATSVEDAIEQYNHNLKYQFSLSPNSSALLTMSETEIESLQQGFFVSDGLQGDFLVRVFEYNVVIRNEIPFYQLRETYTL